MKNLKLVLIAATVATFAASAHDPSNVLVNQFGEAVKNNFGQCVEVKVGGSAPGCGEEKAPQIVDQEFTLGAHALFDTAKSNLRPAGKAELDALAAKLAGGIPGLKSVNGVRVVGHTDSRGSVAYNQGLSERRATSVRNYLVSKGVPANIISAYGEGKMNPIADNNTAAGRQQNRRVQITVSGVATDK